MATRCPNCGFTGARISRDGSFVCVACSHGFEQKLEYPAPPRHAPVAAAGRSSRNLAVLIVAAAVFGLVAVGGLLLFVRSGPDSSPPEEISPIANRTDKADAGNSPALAQPDDAPEPTLSAAIELTGAKGRNGKTAWWILKYTNTGDASLATPKIRTQIMNDNSIPVAEHVSSGWLTELPPGEFLYMLAEVPDPPPGKAHFKVVETTSKGTTGRMTRLKLSNLAVTPHEREFMKDYPWLTGTITNNTEKSAALVRLIGVGFDAEDNIVGYARGLPKTYTLDPGKSSEFKVQTGVWNAEKPVRWEVAGWGRLSK